MPWLKIFTTLRNHPKVEVTAKDLRLPAVHLRGHLLTLWLGTLELAEDGDLSCYDNEMIASLAEYKGDADHFVQTLTDRGWLEDRIVHDWLDYVGDYLVSKYKSRKRDVLAAIWTKHGRIYGGKEKGSKREVNGKYLGSDREVQDKIRYNSINNGFHEPSHTQVQEATFSPVSEEVHSYWIKSREKVGLRTLTNQEKPDAARIGAYILDGVFSIEDYRTAVDNLMADPESRIRYGLRGLLKNIDKWINLSPSQVGTHNEPHGLPFSEILRQQGLIPNE